jgi:creatinine amidohydrolase
MRLPCPSFRALQVPEVVSCTNRPAVALRALVRLAALALLVGAAAEVLPAQQAQGTERARPPRDPRSMGGGDCAANVYNCKDTPNPLPAPNTVWLEEMTWMDVRDALAAGKTTAIIATGGMEPNGPWLVTGKHNHVLRVNCEVIARKLGNALCAPIVKFVPEGSIDPPSGHMLSPGTISTREGTFRALLTDIAQSLKQHGFERIILIGDSGGNQDGQRAVADSLTAIWQGQPIIAHVQEYYDYGAVTDFLAQKGVQQGDDKLHDDVAISLNMFLDDPRSIRLAERVKAGKATINGVSLENRARTTELAQQLVEFRTTVTLEAISKATANKGTLPAPPSSRRGR